MLFGKMSLDIKRASGRSCLAVGGARCLAIMYVLTILYEGNLTRRGTWNELGRESEMRRMNTEEIIMFNASN